MTIRMLRGDAPAVAQVTRLQAPEAPGEIALTILGTGKFLTFAAWNATAIAAAWNASKWPEFLEATATVDGADVLLTSKVAGRPYYVAATVGGQQFGNEVQIITPVNVTGGTATASWLGQTTDAWDPTTTTGADLKDLFEALAGGIVAADELTWTGAAGGPWTVTFGGRYAEQNVPLITIADIDLTGGTAAQNEKQRLSLAATGSEVTFQLRRPDDLQTTDVLSTPLTHGDLEAALAAIGYDTSCTGGPLTSSGTSTDTELDYYAGYFYGSTLRSFNADGDGIGFIGDVSGSLATGLLQFAALIAQGTTITSAILKPLFVSGYDPIAGVTVKAEATDNATWPADAATAAAAALTTAATLFNITGGGLYEIDVTAIVQEIVDRVGWESGHKINFHLIPPPTANTAAMVLTAGAASPVDRIYLEITIGTQSIIIEWTGADAETDIPQLIVVPSGGYAVAPTITTIQNGSPATDPALIVATEVAGGEALPIRDDVRSRGPNHYDDPLNWESDNDTFSVPEDGDAVYVESGKVDLLYGLKQRSAFIALPTVNRLRVTEVHHLWVGLAVQLITTDALPGGLAAATRYYVASIDGPYVQLSATRGGAPVTLTDAGTGTHTLGVQLVSAEIQARWTGKLGLPRLNTNATTYFEYRERFLALWCDAIKIGTGNGGGANRINLDTGTFATTLQAITSGGAIESGVNAVLWKGNHEDNELENISADLGVAIFPEETASFDKLIQRSGTVTLGRGVTGNTIDKTGGALNSLGATIAGKILLN